MNSQTFDENPLPLVVPIKLSRRHIPIHEGCVIWKQEQYDNHIEMLHYLNNQVALGFNPKWMISCHLKHPREYLKPIKETNNPLGFQDRVTYRKGGRLWNQVTYDNYMHKRRNDYDLTEKENHHIRNLIFKYLYGIKRGNQHWKTPNIMFFIEKGKIKLQNHIHILLSGLNCLYDDRIDIEETLNSSVRLRAKSISETRKIHCREIDNPYKAVSYLNKETSGNHLSLDTKNSILLKGTNETIHRI